MAITIYLRSTTTHVGTIGSHGNFDLETTTGTTSSQSFGANTPRTYAYYSASGFPNLTDWTTGDYTWYVDVTTANANVQLTTVRVSRYNSTVTTEKAFGTASPNLTLSTTGLKSGTVSFASPNPGDRAADDRLVILLTFTKLAGGGVQSVSADVNGSGDSRLDAPLIIPVVRDISEGSVSVSESVETQELYIKPISEDSVSASDSIEGEKIPAAPENEFYSVHFVEFPEEVSDSLYVPPPVAVEPVSTTKTHKYNVIGKVTVTKTHKYNLIGLVTSTKTHIFNVIQQITQSKTHKFNVIARIIATKTHKFSVLASVSTTKTHKYNIIQQIIQTKTHKFNVATAAEQVSTTKTHKYNVIGKIIQTKTHLFSVIQRLVTNKTHRFNVLQRVLTTKTHIFSVVARVLTTKTHKYSVIQQIVRTRTHKFHLEGRVSTTKTHKFNIVTKITQTKTHKFNITIAVSPTATKTHKFSILTLVSRLRTHKYNIIGKIIRTRTHKYQMGGRVLLTKRHRYDVGFGGLLQELGGSTNAFVRFQDRVQIIDIIADIQNKVFANVEIITSRPPPHKAIAVVAIAEYASKLLTASAHRSRHRIASGLIVPQIIDTIDNLAVAPYIGIEILEAGSDSQNKIHIQALLRLSQQHQPNILVSSLTQLTQSEKTKIKIASATMLQQTQETVIGSEALLEITAFPRPVLTEEIMSKQKAKILKTLINLLSSDHLFG
jgi:hypothetical protein